MIRVLHHVHLFQWPYGSSDDQVALYVAQTLKADYGEIATVETGDLDLAYQMTNHVDHDWRENASVKVTGPELRARSTSVGDVLIKEDGTRWVVAPYGFVQLPENVEPLGTAFCMECLGRGLRLRWNEDRTGAWQHEDGGDCPTCGGDGRYPLPKQPKPMPLSRAMTRLLINWRGILSPPRPNTLRALERRGLVEIQDIELDLYWLTDAGKAKRDELMQQAGTFTSR